MFIGAYGPIHGSKREDMWAQLVNIRGLWDDSWCVGEDFNRVRFLRERRDCYKLMTSMRCILEIIKKLKLRDLQSF